jgi:uncharacterized protein YjiS (DUF1127 family)
MNASTQTLDAHDALQRFVLAVTAALRNGAAAWHRSRRRRAALRELQALDDRMLKDIGVTRSELSSLVAEVIGAAQPTRRAAMRSLP